MTREECEQIKRELENAWMEYNQENEPCHNSGCVFYSMKHSGNCKFYHYYADDCENYRKEE